MPPSYCIRTVVEVEKQAESVDPGKFMMQLKDLKVLPGYSSGHPMPGILLSEVFFSLDLVNLVYNNNRN